MHLAAAQGDNKHLQILLDSGRVHVDCKDKEGTTPLIVAAAAGHFQAVYELLQQGADLNSKRLVWFSVFKTFFQIQCLLFFQTGTTALFFSAQGGFTDIVNLLLENGALVNSPSIVSKKKKLYKCEIALKYTLYLRMEELLCS